MRGLPKIAIARLKAKPDEGKPTGALTGPPPFQGEAHPDANLLTAFAERTLTERERASVLKHLGQCAECREVASFIVPADALMEKPAHGVAGRRWNPWPVLRWGALAAVLGTVTLVVVLRSGRWQQNQEISKSTTPPNPVGNVTMAPQTVAPLPSVPPPTETAKTKTQADALQSYSNSEAELKKAAGPQQDASLQNPSGRLQAQQHATVMASLRPPPALQTENGPAVSARQEQSQGGKALSAVALPAPAPPAAAPAPPLAASDEAEKKGTEPAAAPQVFRSTTQSIAVSAEPLEPEAAQPSTAKTARRGGASAAMDVAAQTPMLGMDASVRGMKSKANTPAVLWNVSSEGKIERSTDRGKSFQPIAVADNVNFQTVASAGNDVWAAGAGGSLFHSVDAGANWTRVTITSGKTTVTETITAILLSTPQHVTVITSSGSQWISQDSGQHWQKQP